MSVSRTIDIELEAHELATLFANMNAKQQAWFFARVWQIAQDWPGAGLCQQSYDIIRRGSVDTHRAIETLASHLPAETLARLAEQAAQP